MAKFTVRISDLCQFALNGLEKMPVIHYGDLTTSAQDRFCTFFGADVDLCFPICNREDVIE